jgi:hypothetical protein
MQSHFLFDGCERAQAAIEPQIRAQVNAEYATAFAAAGFWGRLRLRREIEHEVARRLDEVSPPDALY